jgi:hypothetical protein
MLQSPIIPQIQLNWHYLEIMSCKKLKAWNIVLDHNDDWKIQLHNFLYPRSPNCRWFQLLFLDSWPLYRVKSWMTQNTVCGCKKRSIIQPNKIFWIVYPYIVCGFIDFAIFESWPFCLTKSWKTQNTVFGYKKSSKIQSDIIFWIVTPNCM